MISFLIPTYDYDCTTLVFNLFKQADALKKQFPDDFDFEILVADDASPSKDLLQVYRLLNLWPGCRFLPLEKNLGRAKIRNFLAGQSRFPYLIFIDCDAEICTDDFVARYWKHRDDGDVVCGALRNPRSCPEGGELRYFYEKSAERQRTVEFRTAHPYTYFTTFNVLFHRKVISQLKFDERCTEYGYEDALMGIMLEKYGYDVSHIDNPLVHNGIDANVVYLSKVETSLRVLHRLGEPLQSFSPLVRLTRKFDKLMLLPFVRLFYRIFRNCMRKNLVGPHPSMFVFKLYKLGYYTNISCKAKGTR